jgi:hypothetical protein
MARLGLERQVTALLAAMNARGAYEMSLVCTDQGLLVASAGDAVDTEVVAGFTSLFDDIVARSERDLGFGRVDEVSLLDTHKGRFVIRPVMVNGRRFFLVAQVPADGTWRRNTTLMCRDLVPLLTPLTLSEAG